MSTTSIDKPRAADGGGKGNGGSPAPAGRLADVMEFEPLVRMSDADEFRAAYGKLQSGEWDEARYTAFRLRFGVYGQLQEGVHMCRIKIPGGILPIDWARSISAINREYSRGPGDIHLTTRQDIQLYHVPKERAPDYVRALYAAGITNREACGNTLRNMNGCMLAGICPREHVDAGVVAQRLAHAFLRHPLVQHMPRKFKVSVSGCETDCASSGIHDMGLIATERDGRKGFIVYGGGGTGGYAISSVKLLDFATEDEVPAALESLVRLHQRYSNRVDRNRARIKFLIKRFGEEKFRALFLEEFERLHGLPQRPWTPLDWRDPDEAPAPESPGGVVHGHDGSVAVIVNPALGLLTSDEMDAVADIAESHGATGFRVTRDQNLAIMGLTPGVEDKVVAEVRALGFDVEDAPGSEPDVVSCPGTTTCRLGITNSQNFGREIVDRVKANGGLDGLTVKISGCQNGCGLHHVADFGFRGMGKKIEGVHAPHYMLYVGGDPRINGAIGVTGPVVPARHAPEALERLIAGYRAERVDGEGVREWALRVGKEGFRALLKPIEEKIDPRDERVFYDWGESERFVTPGAVVGECAAPFAVDDLLADLADDGLIGLDRALLRGRPADGLEFGREGLYYAARRLLLHYGNPAEGLERDDVIAQVRATYAEETPILEALARALEGEAAAAGGGDAAAWRERLAEWLDLVGERVAKPAAEPGFDAAALGDSTGSVMELLRSQGAA